MALALAVAVLAVLAMMPRTGVVSPVAVDPRDWFTPAQLARASDFRGPQLLLAVAGLLEGFARQLIVNDIARYGIASVMLAGWLAYFYWPRAKAPA